MTKNDMIIAHHAEIDRIIDAGNQHITELQDKINVRDACIIELHKVVKEWHKSFRDLHPVFVRQQAIKDVETTLWNHGLWDKRKAE